MWVVVWQIMVSDSPEDDHHISNIEREMILESLREEHTSNTVSSLGFSRKKNCNSPC